MDKKIKQQLLKPLNKSQIVARKESLSVALERLDLIALEQNVLPVLVKDMKQDRASYKFKEATGVKKSLRLSQALYNSGRITWLEYVFYASVPIESIHDDRIMNGGYAAKLDPISNEIRNIEKSHGLIADEYWPRNEGPAAYKKLNRIYESILDDYFYEALREFELNDIAQLWLSNRKEYNTLREKGRRAVFHQEETIPALKDLIARYEKDARLASSVKAFSSAITSLGAGMEGLLLLRCLYSKQKSINTARKLPKRKQPRILDDLTTWTFDNLIEVCLSAGWLQFIESSLAQYDASSLAHILRQMRNYVHPGKIIRTRPWSEIGENDYKKAEAIYIALLSNIDRKKDKSKSKEPTE